MTELGRGTGGAAGLTRSSSPWQPDPQLPCMWRVCGRGSGWEVASSCVAMSEGVRADPFLHTSNSETVFCGADAPSNSLSLLPKRNPSYRAPPRTSFVRIFNHFLAPEYQIHFRLLHPKISPQARISFSGEQENLCSHIYSALVPGPSLFCYSGVLSLFPEKDAVGQRS